MDLLNLWHVLVGFKTKILHWASTCLATYFHRWCTPTLNVCSISFLYLGKDIFSHIEKRWYTFLAQTIMVKWMWQRVVESWMHYMGVMIQCELHWTDLNHTAILWGIMANDGEKWPICFCQNISSWQGGCQSIRLQDFPIADSLLSWTLLQHLIYSPCLQLSATERAWFILLILFPSMVT